MWRLYAPMHMYTLSRDVSWRLAAPICAYVYCPSRVVSFVVPRPKILCGALNEKKSTRPEVSQSLTLVVVQGAASGQQGAGG